MVYLYTFDVSTLPDMDQCAELIKQLPKARQEKVEKCKKEEKARQSLGAGLLLEKVFKEHGICTNDIRIGRHGKPEVDGLYFNLSHSGSMVICAVSEKPVGCDVEQMRSAPRKIATHFFCKSEEEYLRKFDGESYDREFFRLWTIKESYIKMTGEGGSIPLDSFEVELEDGIRIRRDGVLQACVVKEYEMTGYQITACSGK